MDEMNEMSSVSNAHLVTMPLLRESLRRDFMQPQKSFQLLQGTEVFKYLVLFLLWHPCDLH